MNEVKEYSKNDEAGRIVGYRPTDGVNITEPCEFGYHCPVCEYEIITDDKYDFRLNWSEYNGFIWCEVCNIDYPSCLCDPDPLSAIDVYLSTVQQAKEIK